MANYRYNLKVQSGLLAGRKTHFYVYAASDADVLAVADLIDAQLENGARTQVSKVIREASVIDPASASAAEPKAESFSFMNAADPTKKRLSFRVVGLKKSCDSSALAAAIATLGVNHTGLQNQTGEDMDATVATDGGINMFAGGTPRKDLSATG